MATDVRKNLTVVNPQWTALFQSCNVKTMKFGIPFPLAGVEDSSLCVLPFVVLCARFLSLLCTGDGLFKGADSCRNMVSKS